MSYEMKPGSGSMFRNHKKETEKHPDLRGEIMTPDGKRWQVSGWSKTSDKAGKWLALSIQEPYKTSETKEDVKPAPQQTATEPYDNFPF